MKKNILLLNISLGILAVTLLIDRLIVSMPNWLVIVLMLISIAFMGSYIYVNRKDRKDS